MATRMAKALATAAVAAGLIVGVSLGFGTGTWETAQGGSGGEPGMTTGAETPVVIAIDVVANYCTPIPCRPTASRTDIISVEAARPGSVDVRPWR